jgi:hypothetical protein
VEKITKPEKSMNTFRLIGTLIRSENSKIRIIFLVIMSIAVLNYIIDVDMLTSGLVLSDLVIPTLMEFPYYSYYFEVTFLNPLLLLVGFVMIIPISSYLSYRNSTEITVSRILTGFLIGVISIVILYVSWFLLIVIFIFGISVLMEVLIGGEYYWFGDAPFALSGFLFLVFGFGMFLFQRIWVLLVYRGFKPHKSLRKQLSWIRKKGSYGQLGFIGLVMGHQMIKGILYLIVRTPVGFIADPYYSGVDYFPPLHPVSFIIIMSYEIGFFLMLIIYQLVQFHKVNSEAIKEV